MRQYTIEEQSKIGESIASILMLRRNKQGRYKTTWGDKTAIGIFNLIPSLFDKIEDGSFIK